MRRILDRSSDLAGRPRALVSVSDKTGLEEFAKALTAQGWEIVASGGTASHLEEAGVDVVSVDAVTGFPEILDGRVKTLHPKIFGGILADRSEYQHQYELVEQGIEPVEMVVCNFYPFEQQPSAETIDIGGPAMVRAAAKNHESVAVVVSPGDYASVQQELKDEGGLSGETRRRLARKAFETTEAYDAAIAEWLS